MEKRIMGKTGFSVTVLGYGAMELRHLEFKAAEHLLNQVLDLGINYIDTSPDYGPSEEYIGAALSHRRAEFFLASKCGCNIDSTGKGQVPPHIWSKAQLLKNIENSLRLLKTDHLDIWQLHGPAPDELPGGREDEVIETLLDLKKQGKVQAIGISFKNGGPGDPLYPDGYAIKYFRNFLEYQVFDVMQVVYGGLVRRNEQVIANAANHGIGMIIRGVVKHYFTDFSERFTSAGLDNLVGTGENMSQFLLRFALNQAGISTVIIGTRSPAHLAENIRAADAGRLPEGLFELASLKLESIGSKPQDL